jgi:hypothetical protein
MADLFLRDLRDHTAQLERLERPLENPEQHDTAFAH